MTNEELKFIIKAVADIVANIKEWEKDYKYIPKTNEFIHKSFVSNLKINDLFRF